MIDMGQGIRHPSRVTLFFKRNAELFTSQKSAAAKVIHIGCGELPQASSPMMNNFWNTYKGWVEVSSSRSFASIRGST